VSSTEEHLVFFVTEEERATKQKLAFFPLES